MKLSLIGLATVTALVMQVSAQDYYMASLFILGVNVGEQKYVPSADNSVDKIGVEEFNLRYGSVRFRLMIFCFKKSDDDPEPLNGNVNWSLNYINDFDVSFNQLSKKFSTDFFKKSPIAGNISIEDLVGPKKYTKLIKESDFTIRKSGTTFNTKDTHVVSLITDLNILKNTKFSVFAKDELEIKIYQNTKPYESSIINFSIHKMNLSYDKCIDTKNGPKFYMKSEEIKYTQYDLSNIMWKDGKHKLLSGLSQNSKDIDSFIPVKIETEKQHLNVILVINNIPIIRFFQTGKSGFKFDHKLPFEVKSTDSHINFKIYSNALKRKNNIWVAVTKGEKDSFLISDYSKKSLFSKREIEEELISLTLNFECPKILI